MAAGEQALEALLREEEAAREAAQEEEPTAGLDPLMEAVFQEAIDEVKQAGRTVLLSSHILAQVEVLADRISIIRLGKIVESGTLAQLRHLHRTTIVAETAEPADALAARTGIHDLHRTDGQVTFEVEHDHLDDVVRELGALGVRSLVAHPPTLEQLLLRHYGDGLSEVDGEVAS
jgi:ABC-2 type transport system ATP-binding protein